MPRRLSFPRVMKSFSHYFYAKTIRIDYKIVILDEYMSRIPNTNTTNHKLL